MPKYTQGPLYVSPVPDRRNRYRIRQVLSDYPLATVSGDGHANPECHLSDEVVRANADLYAAAPELVEALETTIDSVALLATGRCPSDLVTERIELLKSARAVLAKAKGTP